MAKTASIPSVKTKPARRCLACGAPLPPRLRRYCDMTCPQLLQACLNRRTGLLRALNTRYATFHFTDYTVFMDLLPYGVEYIYSYMMPRRTGRKPVEDFCEMSNLLGTVWWQERNRTKKRYLASRFVLSQADNCQQDPTTVMPMKLSIPSVRAGSLIALQLSPADLSMDNLQERIKNAYRQQAKKHHPDLGGDAHSFRKIQQAYEQLAQWAQHPTFTRRSGFPDKWFYEGYTNRWLKPTVAARKTARRPAP